MSVDKKLKSKQIEILIVEDSLTQAEQLRYILEDEDYIVSVAYNGKEALLSLDKHKPVIVISDILMPEMDGYELCKRMKAEETTRNIPVVLLTSLSGPEDVARGLECGADYFITKPYDRKYILSRIQYILANLELRPRQKMSIGMEVLIAGKKYFINADRLQILDFLISTYETAVQQNHELVRARDELAKMNEILEEKVQERTAALTAEITERKRVEEGLQESEKFNSSLLNSSPNPIHVVNPDTSIEYINPALEKLTGFSKEEIIGSKVPYPWWQKDKLRESNEAFEKVLAEGVVTKRERQFQKKSGEPFWVELTSTAVRDNDKVKYLLTNWVDITERKEAERKLLESELKYSTLVENSTDGIGVIQDGILKFVNSRMATMLGYSEEEGLGKSFINFVYPDYREIVLDRYKKRLAGETVLNNYEVYLISKDGKRVPVEINAAQIEYEGKPADMALIRDVTERKKMQEQLIMQDRMATIGQLTSGIAHELNNPLTSVIGFSELLLSRELPDDIKEDIKIINDGASRTAKIVKNLLTFARKQPKEKLPVDINESIQKIVELRAYEQKVNNIQVDTRFASDLPHITGNASQLQQVFLNIVINAEFFMIEAHKKGTLTITSERIGDFVRLSFADDGTGISQENMRNLFSPFFTTKPVGKGTGLGLSICHGIVSEHGGRIYAESKLGEGATFIIELPVTINEEGE